MAVVKNEISSGQSHQCVMEIFYGHFVLMKSQFGTTVGFGKQLVVSVVRDASSRSHTSRWWGRRPTTTTTTYDRYIHIGIHSIYRYICTWLVGDFQVHIREVTLNFPFQS